MSEERKQVNFRLGAKAHERLEQLAQRWHADKTHVICHAIELLADHDLIAVLCGGYQAAEQGLRAWASQIERASRDNDQAFTRAEWNLMADVNNGCSALYTLHGQWALEAPTTMIWANVEDGHRLDGAGQKWLGTNADAQVTELVRKLRDLDYAHGWAVALAIQWFWEHANDAIDHAKDLWWTIEFRRAHGKRDLP